MGTRRAPSKEAAERKSRRRRRRDGYGDGESGAMVRKSRLGRTGIQALLLFVGPIGSIVFCPRWFHVPALSARNESVGNLVRRCSITADVYSQRSGYKVSIVYQISFQFLCMHGHWLEEISSDFLSKYNGIYSINCVVLSFLAIVQPGSTR
jgi:hypothetical protein